MHPSVNLSSQIWHESRSLKSPPFPQIYLSLNYVRCLNLLVFLSVGDKIEWERNDSISSVHINSTQPSQKNKQTNNKCKQMQQTVLTNSLQLSGKNNNKATWVNENISRGGSDRKVANFSPKVFLHFSSSSLSFLLGG